MDTSRYKRRETQTRRQPQTANPGFSDIVPGSVATRLQNSLTPMVEAVSTPPAALASSNDIMPSRLKRSATKPSLQIAVMHDDSAAYDPAPHQVAAPVANLDMGLPGGPSQSKRSQSQSGPQGFAIARRWLLRATVSVIILVMIAGGVLFSQGYIKLHQVFKGGATTAAALTVNVNPNLLKGEGDGRINVLLLGRGGGKHDAPDLTDTLLLASIDPVNHTSTLLSIPRDLWVDVPNQGAMKINAAWEAGEFKYLGKVSPGSTNQQAIQAGFNEIDQTVESVIGIPINYNVLVDFQAFRQAVDTVSGVTVDVPTDLVDPTMAWENHNNSVLAKAGIQNFDGTTALTYVRSRETTSDFARSQRQRSVLVALKGKVDSLGTLSNPLKISGLLSAFGDNVSTDLSLNDATRLYSIVKGIGDTKVNSVGLSDPPNHFITTGPMNGQSIALPAAGLFNYGAIQTFIRTQLQDGYIIKENAKVAVLNGTATPGVATSLATQLKAYGYNVVSAATAPTSGWAQTTLVDLSHGKAKYTAHYLEQRFNVTAVTSIPDTTIQPNGADFVIIIGSDEATTPKI